jgi:hypothetical protein
MFVIVDWLEVNGIAVDPAERRAELLQEVKQNI